MILDDKNANSHLALDPSNTRGAVGTTHGGEVYPANRRAHNLLVFSPRRSDEALGRVLDRFIARADRPALVRGDPVELVRRYGDPHDQEVAGLVVAMLAYGRVASIKAKAADALARLGPSPATAVDR
ncbi:DUF2400 domain-containing protein, partial [Myxococcota bacterium]|nr:DUF2400 domain-containing protein [Myxococcota bacterium]